MRPKNRKWFGPSLYSRTFEVQLFNIVNVDAVRHRLIPELDMLVIKLEKNHALGCWSRREEILRTLPTTCGMACLLAFNSTFCSVSLYLKYKYGDCQTGSNYASYSGGGKRDIPVLRKSSRTVSVSTFHDFHDATLYRMYKCGGW